MEVEVPPPSPDARLHLLHSILSSSFRLGTTNMPSAAEDGASSPLSREDIASISERCHGYTVADLRSLVNEAAMNAIRRVVAEGSREGAAPGISRWATEIDARLTFADLERALCTIVPSAMRSVRVELANTRFDDVGGNDEVKMKIREAVLWKMSGRRASPAPSDAPDTVVDGCSHQSQEEEMTVLRARQ